MNALQCDRTARSRAIRFGALALAVSLVAAGVAAGDRTNVRGVGMARAMTAAARGIDAIGVNPALLGLKDNRLLEIGLLPFSFHARSDFISYDVYQDYFTGVDDGTGNRVSRFMSDADVVRLLSLLPDEGETRFDVDVSLLSLSFHNSVVGGIGFSITDHIGIQNNLDKDFIRFPFQGSGGSPYDLSDTRQNGWWWREYNIAYAREIPAFIPFAKSMAVGASLKIVRGYGVFETQSYRGNVNMGMDAEGIPTFDALSEFLVRRAGVRQFSEDSIIIDTPFPDPAGKGTGFDLGLTMELNHGIRVSAAVVNIGSISWDQNLVETVGSGQITVTNVFTKQGEDSLLLALRGKNRPGQAFSTPLPTQLRFGAAMRSDEVPFLKFLPGRLLLAVDYLQGLNTSLGNTTSPRFALGAEYRLIPLIPLRTGISIGGGDSFRWAAGFGLDFHFLTFDLSTENIGVLTSLKNFRMFQLSAGLKIKV